MIQAGVAAGLTLAAVAVWRKDLLLYLFDANQARAVGLNTTFLHYLLLVLLSLTIVAALQAVGIILTVAMLIVPGCIGQLLTDRFGRMMSIAAAAAMFSGVMGTYISYFLDGETGACIVLTQAGILTLAALFGPKVRRAVPRAKGPGAPRPTTRRVAGAVKQASANGELGRRTRLERPEPRCVG